MATQLVQDRTIAVRVGYVATDWVNKPAFEAFDAALSEWEVSVIERDGQAIGAAYTKGPEWHVSILPEWRRQWLTRGLLNRLVKCPVSVTKVTPGFDHVGGFLERLGFEHRGDGVFVRECDNGY